MVALQSLTVSVRNKQYL